ncbi:MAG TPA: redoxin domain-containing protein [Capillimicrobium sp.]|nr:redoxin domain-containing protein [Capillimicrobium sp.]
MSDHGAPPQAGSHRFALPAGTPAPEFSLATEDGGTFTQDDLRGQTTVLVFYPFAFSPVCTDQLQVYEEVLPEFERRGAKLYGVSTDATWSQAAFKQQLGISIPQLSDFEPKGAASRALGAYFEPAGMTNRAIVVFGPDATVLWSYVADSPGDLPGANLILDALDAAEDEERAA